MSGIWSQQQEYSLLQGRERREESGKEEYGYHNEGMEEEGEGVRRGRDRRGKKTAVCKGKGVSRQWGDRDAPARYINSLGDKKKCYFWFLKPSVR